MAKIHVVIRTETRSDFAVHEDAIAFLADETEAVKLAEKLEALAVTLDRPVKYSVESTPLFKSADEYKTSERGGIR